MSTTLQSPSIGTTRIASSVIVAAILALVIGATAGSLITRAIVEHEGGDAPIVSTEHWDAGKLAAMEGRVLAEQASPIVAWDAGKLAAMEGRVLAEVFGG